MGIWDNLRSKFANRDRSSATIPSDSDSVTNTVAIGDGSIIFAKYVADPHRRREKIRRVLTDIGKFAFDSVVDESLKTVTGGIQMYKTVKEGLQDQPPLRSANAFKIAGNTAQMEEMQAKLEKMQEKVNMMEQLNKASGQCAKRLDPFKDSPDESSEATASSKADAKKIFIRSRL